ncbi:hypothetical protein Ocin01_18543 [Orchesella cincta]|uniref:Uncharacterized protein n=1 Tax=Orchesella cincta TaxID=48709 RepID=A0A1D2M581_ORCCI|nr:hypothetical protein Ocin01_18543 [Orchesella cincta]
MEMFVSFHFHHLASHPKSRKNHSFPSCFMTTTTAASNDEKAHTFVVRAGSIGIHRVHVSTYDSDLP